MEENRLIRYTFLYIVNCKKPLYQIVVMGENHAFLCDF